MQNLIVWVVVGFLAQLVDGALGMAYGATSSTLLLTAGLAPAAVSASVHLAEIGTTVVSGAAHASFGNVSWSTVRRIALPGAVGAFVGALVLGSVATAAAGPWMAGVLLSIGLFLLARFALRAAPRPQAEQASLGARPLAAIGLVAGFVDATGGGGWGPLATPSLLLSNRMEPRTVVGTVDTSEFAVTVAASAGFLLSLGPAGIDLRVVLVLLAGGMVAAPLAAWLVRRLPARLLGVGVGGLLALTNAGTLLSLFAAPAPLRALVYVLLAAAWAGAVAVALSARLPVAGAQPGGGGAGSSGVPVSSVREADR